MPTQGERQNFLWRPNDNSSTTLARYDQEAEHWTRAFKNANSPKPNFGGTMGTIGLVLQLAIILVWFIFSGIGSILVWLFGSKSGGKFDVSIQSRTPKSSGHKKFR